MALNIDFRFEINLLKSLKPLALNSMDAWPSWPHVIRAHTACGFPDFVMCREVVMLLWPSFASQNTCQHQHTSNGVDMALRCH